MDISQNDEVWVEGLAMALEWQWLLLALAPHRIHREREREREIWNITIWEIWFYFCEIVGLLKKKNKTKRKRKNIYIKAYVAFLPYKCWHGHLNLDTSASNLIFK